LRQRDLHSRGTRMRHTNRLLTNPQDFRRITLDTWLAGAALPTAEPGPAAEDPQEALAAVLLRYLAAFGPASVKDMQTWCGLTRLREVIAPLRPRLRTFRDESGVELFDLPDAPLPHPDTEAPVRFLPEFDNLTLSHADRARVIAPEYQGRTWDRNVAHRVLLVDGTVRGLWRIDTADGAAQLTIEAFAPLTGAERAAVEDEAAGVLRMTAPDAPYDIRYGRVAKGATP
ncbi:DNA glycosylase AlkZ-like family protein, partial [Streptomyces inhibens]|uniref:DNA glycosylase AlkZ-like family protein n=1 Tax=Streptomyces inhibens TaxID=2293571 RepID=UPI003799D75A